MIISASRRTDIPAFFGDWFFERLRAGFADTANPMNAKQIRRVSLTRDDTDCIVFWSKNPAPMLPRLSELDGYMYYFQYTLNGYGADVEPGIPPLDDRLETFLKLSDKLGKNRVLWRYDPILINEKYTPKFHIDMFAKIANSLKGCTRRATISFVDRYKSISKKLDALGAREPSADEIAQICRALAGIAAENGTEICACCEQVNLANYGISRASCVDKSLIEELLGRELKLPRARSQRPLCGCAESADIGTYGTCRHGCAYCYARGKL